MTDKEGNIYALPRALETTSYPTYIRKDWLDKAGLSIPTTLDELEDVLKVFKEKDFAGNGQTVPLLMAEFNLGISGGFTEHGYGYWLDSKDNLIKPAELQPGFKDCIQQMNS